jgi:C4-dicarboxylate-specific signal transduction histidine kinase
MLNALVSARNKGAKQAVNVVEVVQDTAAMLELAVSIHGEAVVAVSEESLHSILENLLGNYASLLARDGAKPQDLQIRVGGDGETAQIEIEDLQGEPCHFPERLVEPFWSEHGRGRGIGLYQSRQLASTEGGSLEAIARPDQPLRFILKLPAIT